MAEDTAAQIRTGIYIFIFAVFVSYVLILLSIGNIYLHDFMGTLTKAPMIANYVSAHKLMGEDSATAAQIYRVCKYMEQDIEDIKFIAKDGIITTNYDIEKLMIKPSARLLLNVQRVSGYTSRYTITIQEVE